MEIKPEFIFFGILILVPIQLYLSPQETGHLKYHMNGLISTLKNYLPNWSIFSEKSEKIDNSGENEENLAVEMDPDGNGAYGLGQYTRQRPPNVEFRVGDIVFHEKLQFRGVIIGWDEKAIAPEKFLKTAHGDNKDFALQPNYAVLIDTRDRLTPQLTYIVQQNLRIEKGAVMHPLIDKFFDKFDEKRQKYVMRPVYKKWYPDD